MSSRRPIRPIDAHVLRLEVLRTERVSPGFQRVTVGGPDLARFTYTGFDQWFRLFMPSGAAVGADAGSIADMRLPHSAGKLWYAQYLAISEAHRPHLANYTVRAFSAERGELDIDFVVHRGESIDGQPGEVEGGAAIWATTVEVGSQLGLLDQGMLFAPADDTTDVIVVVDESGLPAAEGILRSLAPTQTGVAIIEVPTADDIRSLIAPEGVEVRWVVRENIDAHAVPGVAALDETRTLTAPDANAYAFIVGESTLPTEARRHLVAAGLSKNRITFCGFWKSERKVQRQRVGSAAE